MEIVNISKYRAILEPWNLVGKSIVRIKAGNIDLSHNQKIKDGWPLRLVRPIKQFEAETIDITALRTFNGPEDGSLWVEFNQDAKLQFRVVNKPVFLDATAENITKAIKNVEEGNPEDIFFLDLQRATDQVRKFNLNSKADCEKMAEELMAWADGLKEINKIMENNCQEYYEQLGLSKD